jgi:tetratricopeptide (TPR) repeat protein
MHELICRKRLEWFLEFPSENLFDKWTNGIEKIKPIKMSEKRLKELGEKLNQVILDLRKKQEEIEEICKELHEEQTKINKIKRVASEIKETELVTFKVGSKEFQLSKGTLIKCQDSIFPNLLDREVYTIDRSEKYFEEYILEYLRNGNKILTETYLNDKPLSLLTSLQLETQYFQMKYFEIFLNKKIQELQELEGMEKKNEGNEYMKKGKFKEAILSYNQAIQFSNDTGVYYINRGAAYEKMENTDHAIRDYKKGIELNPTYSKGHARLGALYFKIRDYPNAKKSYKMALQLEPENEKYKKDYEEALKF